MWLVGVVIRRYIDILIIIINFPYSTCIRSFLAAASLLLCSFLNVFSVFNNYIEDHILLSSRAVKIYQASFREKLDRKINRKKLADPKTIIVTITIYTHFYLGAVPEAVSGGECGPSGGAERDSVSHSRGIR